MPNLANGEGTTAGLPAAGNAHAQAMTTPLPPPSGADIYKYFRIVKTVKRKASPEKDVRRKVAKTPAPPVPLSNRYEVLDNSKEPLTTSQEAPMRSEKPTPLFVRGSENVTKIVKEISEIGISKFNMKILKNGQEGKLQLNDVADYRKVQARFLERKIPYFTFQLKSERSLRVALKGLHPDTSHDEVKIELENKGFEIRNVSKVKTRRGESTGVFMVDVEPGNERNQGPHEIYKLKRLMHLVVRVEEPYKKKVPIRCHNCQEYSHVKARCTLPAICAICAERHETKNCTKNVKDPSVRKCNNCGEQHAASWQGCGVYKEFRERMNPRQVQNARGGRTPRGARNNTRNVQPVQSVQSGRRDSRSYADMVRNVPSTSSSYEIPKQPGITKIPESDSDFIKLLIMMQEDMRKFHSQVAEIIRRQSVLEKSVDQLTRLLSSKTNHDVL